MHKDKKTGSLKIIYVVKINNSQASVCCYRECDELWPVDGRMKHTTKVFQVQLAPSKARDVL